LLEDTPFFQPEGALRTVILMLAAAWLAVLAGCESRQEPVEPAGEQVESPPEETPPVEEDPALTKRKRANEAAAHASLRVIATAQAQYWRSQAGKYGSLEELGENDLIVGELAAASEPGAARNGYHYKLTPGGFEWSCVALPAQPGVSGDYSYYVDQSGVVRRAPCAGVEDKPAGPESPSMY
jgi:hypothetical protein